MLKDKFAKIARESGMHDDYIDKMWDAVSPSDRVFMDDYVARRACRIFLGRCPEARKPASAHDSDEPDGKLQDYLLPGSNGD